MINCEPYKTDFHISASRYMGYDLDLLGSHEVIDHVTIRFAMYHFLLVVHWNRASIFNRFPDIGPQQILTNQRTNKHDGSQYLLAEVTVLDISHCHGQNIVTQCSDSQQVCSAGPDKQSRGP